MTDRIDLSSTVLFEERRAKNGARIGIARLNAEKTLNALTLEMIDLMGERFSAWAGDPAVALVVLEGAGEKAFCAGGDLHALHASMREHRASTLRDDIRANAYALAFFSREYRLDYLIHNFPKPVLCWGHGIVMGGGLGLMGGASHRVVTERSRIAMPEISIGLYPDVGGTWLLNRMPGRLGLFLALTGAPLNASDALFAGAADYLIRQSDKAPVLDALLAQPWTDSRTENDRHLARFLLGSSASPDGSMGPARENIDLTGNLCSHATVCEIAAAIAGITTQDPWLRQAAATLAAGSPSSAALSHALQQRARSLSLADVFRMELVASMHCAARPDFAEGIRALLIDKDRRPQWSPAALAEAERSVEGYFVSPWQPAEHPLADLGVGSDPGRSP